MKIVIRNILAIIVGFVIGSIVNFGIIEMGKMIIPPPIGADLTTAEGLRASLHLFKPIDFLMPFLAHAFGTFVGALLAAIISTNRKILFSLVIGILFLAGGISMILILPSPLWFSIVDIVLAYIPMSLFAGWLVIKSTLKSRE